MTIFLKIIYRIYLKIIYSSIEIEIVTYLFYNITYTLKGSIVHDLFVTSLINNLLFLQSPKNHILNIILTEQFVKSELEHFKIKFVWINLPLDDYFFHLVE